MNILLLMLLAFAVVFLSIGAWLHKELSWRVVIVGLLLWCASDLAIQIVAFQSHH